ncbi:MAG: hypothetical protein ACKO5K_12715 [Armatimonadota bacterium]
MRTDGEQGVGVESARSWLARFAPFVYAVPETTADQCRDLIARVRRLREESVGVVSGLEVDPGSVEGPELLSTVRHAVASLDGVEEDLRRRLARLAPGDPDGIVDLDALREKMAERAAREELGVATGTAVPEGFKERITGGNRGAAVGLFVFGLGWNAFTLVHATLMIGGMVRAFGWIALGLLLFYAIFFGAGFAMFKGAYETASAVDLELDGWELSVTRTLAGRARRRTWTLGPDSRASAAVPVISRGSGAAAMPALRLSDKDGNEFDIPGGFDPVRRHALERRINAHIAAQA